MKHTNARELATKIRAWLAANPEVTEIRVPDIQRIIGGDVYLPSHVVDQAFQLLNLSGDLSHAYPRGGPRRMSGCTCGYHRAQIYYVRRKRGACATVSTPSQNRQA